MQKNKKKNILKIIKNDKFKFLLTIITFLSISTYLSNINNNSVERTEDSVENLSNINNNSVERTEDYYIYDNKENREIINRFFFIFINFFSEKVKKDNENDFFFKLFLKREIIEEKKKEIDLILEICNKEFTKDNYNSFLKDKELEKETEGTIWLFLNSLKNVIEKSNNKKNQKIYLELIEKNDEIDIPFENLLKIFDINLEIIKKEEFEEEEEINNVISFLNEDSKWENFLKKFHSKNKIIK